MTDLDTNDPDAVWIRPDVDALDVGWGPAVVDDLLEQAEAPEPDEPTLVGRRTWLAEGGLAVGSLVLFAWSLARNGYGNTYYAAAARSMTQSWSNFFYGALDPGGWITVDKPPAAAVAPGRLRPRCSGTRRGPCCCRRPSRGAAAVGCSSSPCAACGAALPASWPAFALALTPVVLAVSRSNNPDGALVLAVVAAAFATERAITTRRARWMYIAGGLFVGLGFLTKLLAAGRRDARHVAGLPAGRRSTRGGAGSGTCCSPARVVRGRGRRVGRCRTTSRRPAAGPTSVGPPTAPPSTWSFGYNGLGRVTGDENGPAAAAARRRRPARWVRRAAGGMDGHSTSSVARPASAGCSTTAWATR